MSCYGPGKGSAKARGPTHSLSNRKWHGAYLLKGVTAFINAWQCQQEDEAQDIRDAAEMAFELVRDKRTMRHG